MTTSLTTTSHNLPVLPSRPKPLERPDFDKLEYHVKRCFDIQPVTVMRSTDHGAVFDVVGYKVNHREDNPVPSSLLDSIHRPAVGGHIAYHLTRLSAHKKNTKGAGAMKVIIEDLGHDLDGVSEWAVFKACEEFRRGDNPFFPDTHDIINTVTRWQEVAKKMGEPSPPPPPKKEPDFVPDPPKYRKRYIRFINLLPKPEKTRWQERWCAAFQKVVEEKHAREKKQG